jgi:putative oxidoreductase
MIDVFPSFLSGRRGIALLLLRLFVGVAFLFHGYGKIVEIAGFAAEFGMPHLIAIAAAYVRFGAGLLLVVGYSHLWPALRLQAMAVATSQLLRRGEQFVSPHGHSLKPRPSTSFLTSP